MNGLKKFIISLFSLFFGVATLILVMVHGWGLEPKNWFWIVGVYLIGNTISILLLRLSGTIKDDDVP